MALKVIFVQYYKYYVFQNYTFLENNLAMHIKNPIIYSDSLILLLGFWLQEVLWARICIQRFHCSIIYISKKLRTVKSNKNQGLGLINDETIIV